MKHFIQRIIAILATSLLIVCILSFLSVWIIRGKSDYRIDPSCHTIAIGNSTIETSINDSILTSWKNCAESGQPFISIYAKLYNILNTNGQIDTVLLSTTPIDFMEFEPNLTKAQLINLRVHIVNAPVELYEDLPAIPFIEAFLSLPSYLQSTFPIRAIGNYIYIERNRLNTHIQRTRKAFAKYKDNKLCLSKEDMEHTHPLQIKWFKKIINLCKEHNTQLVLFNAPMYNLDEFYCREDYFDLLSTFSDNDLLIADYSEFQFPDTSYMGDIIHLNHKGADYFSNHLKKHGLHTETLKEYVSQHTNHP